MVSQSTVSTVGYGPRPAGTVRSVTLRSHRALALCGHPDPTEVQPARAVHLLVGENGPGSGAG